LFPCCLPAFLVFSVFSAFSAFSAFSTARSAVAAFFARRHFSDEWLLTAAK
jgi:hypothetical protein